MPPVTPRRTRAIRGPSVRVAVLDLPLGDLLERHRQVVLGARLDERRRVLVEGALAQLVVVVVDLPSALSSDDDERVALPDVLEQRVDAGMDHGADMLPAAASSLRTMPSSSPTARSRSSLTITWSN